MASPQPQASLEQTPLEEANDLIDRAEALVRDESITSKGDLARSLKIAPSLLYDTLSQAYTTAGREPPSWVDSKARIPVPHTKRRVFKSRSTLQSVIPTTVLHDLGLDHEDHVHFHRIPEGSSQKSILAQVLSLIDEGRPVYILASK